MIKKRDTAREMKQGYEARGYEARDYEARGMKQGTMKQLGMHKGVIK